MSDEPDRTAPRGRPVFVAWDHGTPGLRDTLEEWRDFPNHGKATGDPDVIPKVVGLDRPSGTVWGTVKKAIDGSSLALVFLDQPNVNVAVELGYAMAQGIPVCLTYFGGTAPPWLGSAPFTSELAHADGDLDELLRTCRREDGERYNVPGVPATGTVIVCTMTASSAASSAGPPNIPTGLWQPWMRASSPTFWNCSVTSNA